MTNTYSAPRHKLAAIAVVASLLASLVLELYGPRMLGLESKPQWMAWMHLALGLISVVTVPMAWRWAYRRDAG